MSTAGIPALLICEEYDDVWLFTAAHKASGGGVDGSLLKIIELSESIADKPG